LNVRYGVVGGCVSHQTDNGPRDAGEIPGLGIRGMMFSLVC
jgi:hypothetical protein